MREYQVPYSNKLAPISLPENQVDFVGTLPETKEMPNWKEELSHRLDVPTSGPALSTMLRRGEHIVILVEDNTRHTPVKEILPILSQYLISNGCSLEQIEILVAPGTHRTLTNEELWEKLGRYAMTKLKVSQHDYRIENQLIQLDDVLIGDLRIPVLVNKVVGEANLLIGLGNIIPHPNAGYSGGAKILVPGCCGKETVSAMHTAAALMGYLPLGMEENACRQSLEKVARVVGLDFIVNVVLNAENQVADIVTGDCILAHRAGAKTAKKIFGVPVKEPADILISCSYPYDIDYWQCEKAVISGYFAVKQGGIIILSAPCFEGLAHNHDDLLQWLELDSREIRTRMLKILSGKDKGDLVAAGIAMGAVMVREKADIFIYTKGVSSEQIQRMGYRGFSSLQSAVDTALLMKPKGRIGILPRGGDCLPYLDK